MRLQSKRSGRTTNIQRFVRVVAVLSVLAFALGFVRVALVLSNARLENHLFLESSFFGTATCVEIFNSMFRFEISMIKGSAPAS